MMLRLGLIFSILFMLVSCSSEPALSPEDAVREWVEQVEIAAKAKKVSDLKALISPDYQDSQGNDRQKLLLTARLMFKRNESIGISNEIIDIRVNGDTAIVKTLTAFSGSQMGASLGMTDANYQFSVNLLKSGDGWQATSVTYQPKR